MLPSNETAVMYWWTLPLVTLEGELLITCLHGAVSSQQQSDEQLRDINIKITKATLIVCLY